MNALLKEVMVRSFPPLSLTHYSFFGSICFCCACCLSLSVSSLPLSMSVSLLPL